MTASELARYNLARLVAASGRDPKDVAIRAWPNTARMGSPLWQSTVIARHQKLRRYLGEKLRDGEPVTIPLDELDNLARALEVPRAEFLREPSIQTHSTDTVTA